MSHNFGISGKVLTGVLTLACWIGGPVTARTERSCDCPPTVSAATSKGNVVGNRGGRTPAIYEPLSGLDSIIGAILRLLGLGGEPPDNDTEEWEVDPDELGSDESADTGGGSR
jgi:hypothetical protein